MTFLPPHVVGNYLHMSTRPNLEMHFVIECNRRLAKYTLSVVSMLGVEEKPSLF